MQDVDSLSRHPDMIIRNDTLKARLKNAQLKDEHICTYESLVSAMTLKSILLGMIFFTNLSMVVSFL